MIICGKAATTTLSPVGLPLLSEAMHNEHDLHYANWICKGVSAT